LEVLRLFFSNFFVDYLGGPSGLVEIPRPHPLPLSGGAIGFAGKLPQYWLMYALFLLAAAVLIRLEYSRFGLVASAIRQRDLLAETLGVDIIRYKLGVFVLGSFFAGLVGVFFAHSHQVLHSSDFGLEPMVLLVVFTVIGGAQSVWGPVVGTLVLAVTSELLRELHHYEILVYGAVLMVVMLVCRDYGPPSAAGAGSRARSRRRRCSASRRCWTTSSSRSSCTRRRHSSRRSSGPPPTGTGNGRPAPVPARCWRRCVCWTWRTSAPGTCRTGTRRRSASPWCSRRRPSS